MSSIAKISVEKRDSKDQFLYDLDKSKTLCEIVQDICKTSGLPVSSVYGLKLLQTKNNPYVNTYVSDISYKDIQHSACLKIVYSIHYLLMNRILPNLKKDNSIEKEICYEELLKLAVDSVFIDELGKTGHYKKIIETFVECNLTENECLALLMTICHLFQKSYITDTSLNLLDKTIVIIKNRDEHSTENIKYALSILHKILIQKDPVFSKWKEQIIREIHIKDLTPYIWCKDSNILHYGILLLINTIIRLCKGEQRAQAIKEMNLKQNRDNIHKRIIAPGGLDKNMEHELYVIQTYILSLYNEALRSEVNQDDNGLFKREEFELSDEDIRRLTVLMDFEELESYPNRINSTENILAYSLSERISLASIISESSRKSSIRSSRNTSFSIDYENFTINYLTLEALRYFRRNHFKVFKQSQVEEKLYEPGIFVTSEKVVKILAKLLHIGTDLPDSRSTLYQPIVFNSSSRTPFFLELFSRSMWLLSRTRREMKVSTIEDYPKVMNVFEKQIKMILARRPMDFQRLTQDMTEIDFQEVMKQWQEEKNEELNQLLLSNPCVKELKKMYCKENEVYIHMKRIDLLKCGAYFPKVYEKKTNGRIFVKLSANEKDLHIYDVKNEKNNRLGTQKNISISDITHIAVGLNCKHCNLSKSPSLAFSIIINNSESQVNFIAKDERMAAYWTDAFNILTDNSRRSDFYNRELDKLVDMDIRLKLLELQDVPIPKHPPVVPPPPQTLKPAIPRKPMALLKK